MCGSSNHAATEAKNQEAARQQQTNATTRRVNDIFDSPTRRAGYADFETALRQFLTGQLTRQKAVQDRNLRFSLANRGLTGGSAAVDANRTLGEEFTQGALGVERKTQGALSELRGTDEASRLQLIQLAQTGVNTGTAASQAASALRNNLGASRASATADGLGDVFATTAATYKKAQEDAETRRASRYPTLGLY